MKFFVNQNRLPRAFRIPTIFATLGLGSALAIIGATENFPTKNTADKKTLALQTVN